jgi:acetyl-CoA acetyltransferase
MTRRYTKSAAALAVEAVQLALADAGLVKEDLDGLLTHGGVGPEAWPDAASGGGLHNMMGLRNLRVYSQWINRGSAAGQNLVLSAHAVQSGMADTVCYVFADAPLTLTSSSGSGAYGGAGRPMGGFGGLNTAYGFFGANTSYALAARRHMALYGTTNDHLGAVAVSNRKWAGMNPMAIYRDPMTLEDYHNSRWVVDPFHLFDCCMVNNGAIAFITTTEERARDLKQPPAFILAWVRGIPETPAAEAMRTRCIRAPR